MSDWMVAFPRLKENFQFRSTISQDDCNQVAELAMEEG